MRHLLVLVTVASAFLAGSSLDAQVDTAPAIELPARVRVRVSYPLGHPSARHHVVIGALVRVDSDSVVVTRGGNRIALPRYGVREIAVPAGYVSHGATFARGFLIGLGAGAALGAGIGALSDPGCGASSVSCGSRRENALLAGAVVGTLGAVLGGIGGALSGGERWRPVTIDGATRIGLVLLPRGLAVTLGHS